MTIKTTNNNLMWTSSLGLMTWDDTLHYVQNLKYAGYSDWRVPTILELEVALKKSSFKKEKHIVWSCDSHGKDCCTKSNAWYANFKKKQVGSYLKDSLFNAYAVRDI